ncbi:MAG: hypothetical protein RIR79_1352 [Pseudomonadota bacterium]|jgi:glutamate-ammonia-ligase adenylyltransferase
MTRNDLTDKAEHSRFVQRIRRRYATERADLPSGIPNRSRMEALFAHLQNKGIEVGSALRIVRQLVMERLAELDCNQQITLQAVTLAMTELAEFALQIAADEAVRTLGKRFEFCIVGMGKLGARELNVSSDIDIIYVYDDENKTSNHSEYFRKLVRQIQTLIGDTTEHGFVFRVDLALRPNGNSGPPAVSLGALEEYFHVQGREWERFAWLKSRVIVGAGLGVAQKLRSIVVPFVFRRYLDYNVFEALRILHRQIRDHATQRSAGRPERANDVKLSRGGIREIEFTVQLLQVVRGGQYPELRTRPTQSALQRLVQAKLLPQATADALAQAYIFLRNVEHRIQYLDDQQTHILPTQDADLEWIALSLGFADVSIFLHTLNGHRECVAQEFDALLGGASEAPANVCKQCNMGSNGGHGGGHGDTNPEIVLARLSESFQARTRMLRDESYQRLLRLIQRTWQWVHTGMVTEATALRFTDWLEPLLRRESYLAMLLERPNIHERLLRILGAARWPAKYLLQHPGVMDELASTAMLEERFDFAEFVDELERRRQALKSSGEDDDEALLNLLRRAHHAETFRTLVRDVEGRLSVEQVADDLSALAEAMLQITTQWCWERLRNRHQEECRFGIIAYGKLGGKELGYGSDLDIVFVYDDAHERAGEVYAALVRKLITWLTVKTGEGDLYEIDTALRPNGNSGLLVTRFEAYADYQQQRGNNTAWTWEHQAITRARCVLGATDLRAKFDAVREKVITAPRDAIGLREEITAMRAKVRTAHPVRAGMFDVKHSAGGMVDVEFAVQYLVLAHSQHHPELRPNVGNIALLQQAQDLGLMPTPLGENAAQAYRHLRQLQHHARLDDAPAQVEMHQVEAEREAGLKVWECVL